MRFAQHVECMPSGKESGPAVAIDMISLRRKKILTGEAIFFEQLLALLAELSISAHSQGTWRPKIFIQMTSSRKMSYKHPTLRGLNVFPPASIPDFREVLGGGHFPRGQERKRKQLGPFRQALPGPRTDKGRREVRANCQSGRYGRREVLTNCKVGNEFEVRNFLEGQMKGKGPGSRLA